MIITYLLPYSYFLSFPEKPPLYDDLPGSANNQLNQPQMVTDPPSENAPLNRASNLMDFNATVQNPGKIISDFK